MIERLAFTVIHRGGDIVMEQMRQPSANGHDLSFVGSVVPDESDPLDAAIERLQSRLGFSRLQPERLIRPAEYSYHNKTGYFYELLIPGNTHIRPNEDGQVSELVIKGLHEVLEASRQGQLMELSDMYVSKKWF